MPASMPAPSPSDTPSGTAAHRPSAFRRHRVWWVLGLAAVVVQVVAIYEPSGPPSPRWFPDLDKVGHLGMFAAPVAGLLLATRTPAGRLGARARWWVPAVFAAHAVVSELIQYAFYSTRDGDWRDSLADGCGIVLGVLAALVWAAAARRAPSRPPGSRS